MVQPLLDALAPVRPLYNEDRPAVRVFSSLVFFSRYCDAPATVLLVDIFCAACSYHPGRYCPGSATGARVELEIYQSGRPSAQATQAWYAALTKLGVKNLKIRAARPGDQAGVATVGAVPNETYRVVGELNERGEVVVSWWAIQSRRHAGLLGLDGQAWRSRRGSADGNKKRVWSQMNNSWLP